MMRDADVGLLLEVARMLLGNDQIQQELREQLPKDEEPADIERRYPVRYHDLVANKRQPQRDHQDPRLPCRRSPFGRHSCSLI